MKTPSFFSTSVADKSQEEAFEEASLRNALERMGAGGPARSRQQQPSQRPAADNAQNKRRRFVKDGDVQVEKHSLTRTQPRTLAVPKTFTTSRAAHFSDDEAGEVSKIRRQLAEERLRAEDAERQLENLQSAQKGMETRQAHADLMVRELTAKLQERDAELSEQSRMVRSLQRDLERMEEEAQDLRKKLEAKPRGRPRIRPVAAEAAELDAEQDDDISADEPQPVKWWKD
ncbi:hypothetical protein [Acetobacter cibinongensis]|nr:hypothetical protein [Acetobacter cibinongensis]